MQEDRPGGLSGALFVPGTLVAWIFSADPAASLPQIRKFYVFLELLVVFSLLRSLRMASFLFFAADARKTIGLAALRGPDGGRHTSGRDAGHLDRDGSGRAFS